MNQLFNQPKSLKTVVYAALPSSLDWILIAKSERGVCAIFMGEDVGNLVVDLQGRFTEVEVIAGDDEFAKSMAPVVDYIEKSVAVFPLPMDIQGTVFQKRVWEALMTIPQGATVTYSDIAKQMGLPTATRAVAGACAMNKLAVVIPCHRVIRQDGGLSGYRWGVERKKILLEREKFL